MRTVKKTIFTLNVDGYAPEITALTYPLIEAYAEKIGADFHIIKERKFPEWPVTYEKLQIYQLAQEMENDWNIYIDSDALVHPDTQDLTLLIPRDTVAHFGKDHAPTRWRSDRFFQRDGRNFGTGNWLTVASDLCIDIWRPLDDLTPEQAIDNIFPTVFEKRSGIITRDHLIDDYTLSRNIAKFGIKATTFKEIFIEMGHVEVKDDQGRVRMVDGVLVSKIQSELACIGHGHFVDMLKSIKDAAIPVPKFYPWLEGVYGVKFWDISLSMYAGVIDTIEKHPEQIVNYKPKTTGDAPSA